GILAALDPAGDVDQILRRRLAEHVVDGAAARHVVDAGQDLHQRPVAGRRLEGAAGARGGDQRGRREERGATQPGAATPARLAPGSSLAHRSPGYRRRTSRCPSLSEVPPNSLKNMRLSALSSLSEMVSSAPSGARLK